MHILLWYFYFDIDTYFLLAIIISFVFTMNELNNLVSSQICSNKSVIPSPFSVTFVS